MNAKTKAQRISLEKRIRLFYSLLDERKFTECYRMIDPVVRDRPSSVTLYQYENCLRAFLDHYREIGIREIDITLHLDEPSPLYNDRDFAVGQTTWEDGLGAEHTFQERWVREGRSWYTRSTGFLVPQENEIRSEPRLSAGKGKGPGPA